MQYQINLKIKYNRGDLLKLNVNLNIQWQADIPIMEIY